MVGIALSAPCSSSCPEASTSGPFTWRSCWSGPSPPLPAVVLQWGSDWTRRPGSGETETLTYPWHVVFLSEGLKESLLDCLAHRKRMQQRTKGGWGAGKRSVVGASGWARRDAGGLALEGAGRNSPSSCWLPAPWQSPGTHTDTDRPPLV